MPASVTGMFKQTTTDLKRRFNERAADRSKRRVEKEIAEMQALDNHYLLLNSSSEDRRLSSMLASSCIASNMSCSSESTASSSKLSSLYKQSSCPQETQVIHPVVYKRDIYLKHMEKPSKVQPSLKPVEESSKEKLRGIENLGIENRGNISFFDDSKGTTLDSKGAILPPWSLAGSMLCREMDNKRVMREITKAPQSMYSPQRPIGLPANTIMASMVFRTFEQEEQFSRGGSDGRYPDKTEHSSIPEVVISSSSDSRSAEGSNVSAITMCSSEANSDPRMMKASKDLLAILQSNNFAAFDVKPKAKLYEI